MKGQSIWSLLWLIISVVVIAMLIVISTPLIGRTLNAAINQVDTFQAMELASAVVLTGVAQEGFFYTYDGLPQRDQPDCARVYKTYVKVGAREMDFGQLSPLDVPVKLVSLGTSEETAGTILQEHQPIVIDCKPDRKLIFRRTAEEVTIEVAG